MKRIAKISAIAAMLALALALGACGGPSPEEEEASGGSPAPQASDVSEEAAIPTGTVNGSTYQNRAFGISLTAPNGTTVSTKDELAGLTAQQAPGVTMDFNAINPETGATVNVNIEDLAATGSIDLSPEQYVEAARGPLEEQFAAVGASIADYNITSLTLGDLTLPMIELSITSETPMIYEKIACIRSGDYMMSITFGAMDEGAFAELMGGLVPMAQ